MARQAHKKSPDPWNDLVRFVCFFLLSTVGMGAIGLALFAEPLKGYYADQTYLKARQRKIDKIQQIYRQQEELLAHADHPAVVERIAVSNFNYVPAAEQDSKSLNRPEEWPDLKKALDEIGRDQPAKTPSSLQKLAEKLADRPQQQMMLMIMGAALVIIALACFYKLR